MTIVQKIEKAITDCGFSVYYHNYYDINRIIDFANFPATLFFLLRAFESENIGGIRYDIHDVQIMFAERLPLDFTGQEAETIIDGCKKRADVFIDSLALSADLVLVQHMGGERIYGDYDINLCGYLVQLRLREREIKC